jgi:SAM-dependent methyltransferase
MDHYTNLASHYDEYYRYSDDYVNYFTDKIIEGLAINNKETVVEVGAGTGIFAREIQNKIPSLRMICVDNSAIMLNGNKDGRIMQICKDAVEFSREKIAYDKVYMKEFIHHIARENRLSLFKGLYSQLTSNGVLLILVEPERLNYPLFEEALRRFESRQPSHLQIISELQLAGFSTSFSVKSYPICLAKSKYIEMVRNRYMSVLEYFTDTELERGIKSIHESQRSDDLEFVEIFYSIKGVKSITVKDGQNPGFSYSNARRMLGKLIPWKRS